MFRTRKAMRSGSTPDPDNAGAPPPPGHGGRARSVVPIQGGNSPSPGQTTLRGTTKSRQPLLVTASAAVAGIWFCQWIAPPAWAMAVVFLTSTGILQFVGSRSMGISHVATAQREPGKRFATRVYLSAAHSRRNLLFLLAVAAGFAALHSTNTAFPEQTPFLRETANGPIVATAVGIVAGLPRASASGDSCDFTIRLNSLGHGDRNITTRNRLRVNLHAPPPRYGDLLLLRGTLQRPEPSRNPGSFDRAAHLAHRGILLELEVLRPRDQRLLRVGQGSPLLAAALRAKAWIEHRLAVDLTDSPEIIAILKGMVLGAREDTSRETKDAFRHSGTMHVFAVSGLHVGIIATILWGLLSPFGLGKQRTVLVILPLLVVYAGITGLRPSTVRATIMICITFGGLLFDRKGNLLNSLGAAAFLILLADTRQLFSIGFQLSFCVLLAITLLAPHFRNACRPWTRTDPFIPQSLLTTAERRSSKARTYAAGLVCVSLAAWLGSLPLMLHHFHLVTPVAVLANCVLVPLAWLVLATALFTLLGSLLCLPLLPVLFNNANWATVHVILGSATLFAHVPGGHFHWAPVRQIRRPDCRLTVFDLGAGGAAHLEARGGGHWLIDTGSASDHRFTVQPALAASGVNRLRGLVLTHGDVKHVGGAVPALSMWNPRRVLEPDTRDRSTFRAAFHSALADRGRTSEKLRAGDVIEIGAGARLSIVYPPAEARGSLSDDKCLVALLECLGWRVLLMSDSGFPTVRALVASGRDLTCDVLTLGRHAGDFTGGATFLARVNPRVIIASNSSFPPEEAIPPEWRKELVLRKVALFDQAQTGAVTIDFRASRLELRPALGRQNLVITKKGRP